MGAWVTLPSSGNSTNTKLQVWCLSSLHNFQQAEENPLQFPALLGSLIRLCNTSLNARATEKKKSRIQQPHPSQIYRYWNAWLRMNLSLIWSLARNFLFHDNPLTCQVSFGSFRSGSMKYLSLEPWLATGLGFKAILKQRGLQWIQHTGIAI